MRQRKDQAMTGKLEAAIAGMGPEEMLAYLNAQTFGDADGPADVPRPSSPADPDYGQWYGEVRDQGVDYQEGTWDEVRHLRTIGVIPAAVYSTAYRAFLAKDAPAEPETTAAPEAAPDAEPDAGADGGPAEGKRLSFARTT